VPPLLSRREDWVPAKTFAWVGIVLVLAFWVLDAAAHALFYRHGDLVHAVFTPEPGALVLRLIGVFGIAVVFFAASALHTRTRSAERAERVAQENLRLMFDRSPDAVLSMSTDGQVTYANQNAEGVFGIPPDRLVGMRCRDLPGSDRCFCDSCPLSELAESGEALTRKVHCTGEDHERWVEQRWYPLSDETGDLVSVVEILRDVTDEELGKRALADSHDELERHVEARTAELVRTSAALRESEERYRSMFEENRAVMYIVDAERCVIADANDAATDFYGYSHAELVGMPVSLLHSIDAKEVAAKVEAVCDAREGHSFFEQRTRSGDMLEVEVYASVLEVDGRAFLYNIVHDISERRRAEHAAERAFEELDRIFQGSPDGMRVLDADHTVVRVNNTFEELVGLPADSILGRKCHEVFWGPQCHTPECPLTRIMAGEREVDYETDKTRPDGTTTPCLVTVRPHYSDGTLVGAVESFRDITERKMAEETIRHMALHDQLTGLPNRTLMKDRLDLAAGRASRHGDGLAVLFMDIDDFKYINDSLGHAAGDAILRSFAHRVRDTLRHEDTMARMGGDEFVILLPGVKDRAAILRVVEKIRRSLEEPFAYGGRSFRVTTSIGVALYSDTDETPDALVERADRAMYSVKSALGGGFGFAEASGLITEVDRTT
jgi:diguanylate cyclase (GGDEF)-like protein/PAS domain S-box-containing protein